jgi:SAM-dependent methyltransferase
VSVHERALAEAFDHQADRFEKAPVQSDPAALDRLVRFASLSPNSLVLDAGCGPGLVSQAFLQAGHRVHGVDLSAEMVARARRRCQSFGDRVRFEQRSLFDESLAGSFDAAVSRFVLHHTPDHLAFVRRQVHLLRPGGVLVLCDHTTDTDPECAQYHHELECARDKTHTGNATTGALADLFAEANLEAVQLIEEPFTLDFDEWFDRGTPSMDQETVRSKLLSAPPIRGFRVERLADNQVRIHGWKALVRGTKAVVPGGCIGDAIGSQSGRIR